MSFADATHPNHPEAAKNLPPSAAPPEPERPEPTVAPASEWEGHGDIATRALPRCSEMENAIVELPRGLLDGYPLTFTPDQDEQTPNRVRLSWLDASLFVKGSRLHKRQVMNALHHTKVPYVWDFGLSVWKVFETRGDTAFMGQLAQRGQHEAFAHALSANLSSFCRERTDAAPQELVETLESLSQEAPLLTEDGVTSVLRYAIANYLADPYTKIEGKRPSVESKAEFLDSAGTLLKSFIKDAAREKKADAFSKSLTGFLTELSKEFSTAEQSDAIYGIATGTFLGACFKLATEMTEKDRGSKEFWTGISDSFFSILTSGVSIPCPPATVGTAAVGALVHMLITTQFSVRDFSRNINKLRAAIKTDTLDQPTPIGSKPKTRGERLAQAQNFIYHMDVAINANGFS